MERGEKTVENLSLYQITNAFPTIMENEEITEEEKKKIEEELTVLLQNKSKNIIGYTKNIELTIEAMKQEEERIAHNRKMLENRLTKFKDYVKDCMELNGFIKIETEIGTLSLAKSPISVEITDVDKIPGEYKKEVTEIKILKDKIRNHFKDTGEIIDGVRIITDNKNLRIK